MSIKISRTKKRLSSNGGLIAAQEALKSLKVRSFVGTGLPELKSGPFRSEKKISDLMLGSLAGADCLDDLERYSGDASFASICGGKVYSPKSYGDFLRSFSSINLAQLRWSLYDFGFYVRRRCGLDSKQFFFDIDSTPNIQYGRKMEGVRKNHKGQNCLDTLNLYDQFGIQYHIGVRPGATDTAQDCELIVHEVMSSYRRYKERWFPKSHVCFRADRGYYQASFINACVAKSADIVIGVTQDQHHFPRIISQIHNWQSTDPDDDKRIKFYDGREVDIGTTNYRPSGYERRLRYVVMRAKKPLDPMYPDHVEYDYYAFATTYSELLMTEEEVIRCYRKRGQAENFIKENKHGFDLKHYPCLKLDANRAYALITTFAYNVMRFMALIQNPNKPYYSKNIRMRWIKIPSLVARTGGKTVLQFMDSHYKEMTRWFELIHNNQSLAMA